MEIYETQKNIEWQRLFICKESLTYYSLLEIKKAFGQKAMDILDKDWKVKIRTLIVNNK